MIAPATIVNESMTGRDLFTLLLRQRLDEFGIPLVVNFGTAGR